MKKALAILCSIICVLALTVPTFAGYFNDKGYYIGSPTVKPGPGFSSGGTIGKNDNLFIVPYGQKNTLSTESANQFTNAYNSITSNVVTPSGKSLNQTMTTISSKTNVPTNKLAVSDLFIISQRSNSSVSRNASFDMLSTDTTKSAYHTVLVSENFAHFASILRFENDEWTIVENAYVNEDGDLVMDFDELGIFAVVVNTTGMEAPETISVGSVALVAIGSALVVGSLTTCLFLIFGKKRANAAV